MCKSLVIVFVGLLVLAGCANKARNSEYEGRNFTTGLAFTSADVRVIEQRRYPESPQDGTDSRASQSAHRTIVCAEPGPDVAEALSTIEKIQAKGGNGTANGSLTSDFETQQAIQELAGRTTALLGLRDGLFRACEAYANGAIGDDAYALILSRYSQLMATLFLARDIEEVGKSAPAFAALQNKLPTQSANVGGGAAGGNGANANGAGGGAGKGNAGGAAKKGGKQAAYDGAMPDVGALVNGALYRGGSSPITYAKAMAGAPAKGVGKTNGAAADGGGGSSGATRSAEATAAQAIAGMEKEYLNIDSNPFDVLDALIVVCINHDDPTLLRPPSQSDTKSKNSFLNEICDVSKLENLARVLRHK